MRTVILNEANDIYLLAKVTKVTETVAQPYAERLEYIVCYSFDRSNGTWTWGNYFVGDNIDSLEDAIKLFRQKAYGEVD